MTPVVSGSTGVARYVTELGAALERQGVKLDRFAIGRRSFSAPPGTRHVPLPARVADAWWTVAQFPRLERLTGDADVVHATGLLIPPSGLPVVATVHDLAALRYPALHPRRHVRQQRRHLSALRRAARILAVSKATAADLVRHGVNAGRLTVSPLGLTALPAPALPLPDEPPAREFLLAVGETSPRKGYDVLLRALTRVDPGPSLVIVGPPAGDEERLHSMVVALGLAHRVRTFGRVDDAALAGLYERSLALCFPSRSEGFGLPVLEAMAAGVPVLVSDIAVLREVAGDAGIYLPPEDEHAWAQAIRSQQRDGQMREQLARAGRARAAHFTWERTALTTIEGYRLALGRERE